MLHFLLFLVVLFCCFIVFLHFATLKYVNPYKLTMIFGKKGSGKSTTLTRIAYEASKAGKQIYANIPLPNAHVISEADIGFYNIPPDSVLIIDEAGMVWDNRHFKNFKPDVRDWFKLQRHHRVRVYLASQTFDIDKNCGICVMICILLNVALEFLHMGAGSLAKLHLLSRSVIQNHGLLKIWSSILFFFVGLALAWLRLYRVILAYLILSMSSRCRSRLILGLSAPLVALCLLAVMSGCIFLKTFVLTFILLLPLILAAVNLKKYKNYGILRKCPRRRK